MRVRERRVEDLDHLVAIARRVRTSDRYPDHLPDGDFIRFLTRPEPLGAWIATQDHAIVGMSRSTPRRLDP
jgi:hypothetical protein